MNFETHLNDLVKQAINSIKQVEEPPELDNDMSKYCIIENLLLIDSF